MNTDIFVPITFLVVVAFLGRELLRQQAGKRQAMHHTLQEAARSGVSLPPGVLARLARAADPRRADLRRAIQLAVVTVIVLVLGVLLPFSNADAQTGFLCIAVVPGLLAATYGLFWALWYRGTADD